MTDPNRWSDAPQTAAQKLVALSAEVPPRPVDLAEGWNRVLVASARPRRDWRLIPVVGASLALGAALVVMLGGPALPQVLVESGAHWELRNSEVVISAGRVTVSGASAKIATPHVRIKLLSGRVSAEVTTEGTLLWVEEGEVVLNSGARLGPGTSTRFEPRLSEPAEAEIANRLLAAAPTTPLCEDAEQLSRCLELEGRGVGLQAQAALYELGAYHARNEEPALALEAWRASLARFPRGVLHPEVRLALLVELIRQGRHAEADQVARQFEASCPDDPRRLDVAKLRPGLQ